MIKFLDNFKKYVSEDTSQFFPAYKESAGFDLYNAGPALDFDSGRKLLIPTGVSICLQPDEVALIFQRGSAHKSPLFHKAGVVDYGYTGEIFVSSVNLEEGLYKDDEREEINSIIDLLEIDTDTDPYSDRRYYFINVPKRIPSNFPGFKIEQGAKLPFQLIVVKCNNKFGEVSDEEWESYCQASVRKDRKLGSSDKSI